VDALEWVEELKTRFQQARDEIQKLGKTGMLSISTG